MAVRNRKNKAPKRKFMTKLKADPIGQTKREIKKLGYWKYPLGLVVAGFATAPFADEIVSIGSKVSPSIGSLMSAFTGYGKNLRTRFSQ